MSLDIQPLGQIQASSTVFHISIERAGKIWAASPAGLFLASDGEWSPVGNNFPFAQVGTVLSMGKTVLAAGLSGGMVYSRQAGQTWQYCILEQIRNPITCLAASPNFEMDQVMLAGSAGDGILRSVNAGQSWQLVNFGLRNFQILSLAAAGPWNQREPVFAGSEDGVYSSPNGGRAWRFSGLEGMAVLSLAVHPDFYHQPILLAGTDGQGLWRSLDGGKNWAQVRIPGFDSLTINAMIYGSDTCVMATSEAGILLSRDQGSNWTQSEAQLPPILTLAAYEDSLYAGTYQYGIYRSADQGLTWEMVPSWVAQRFSKLLHWPNRNFQFWLAFGLQSGLWYSDDQARSWQPVPGIDNALTWYCLAACPSDLLVGGDGGVHRLEPSLQQGDMTLHTGEAVVCLSSLDSLVFAGSISGKLWSSQDCGQTWKTLESPRDGYGLVSLGAIKQGVGVLLVAAFLNERQEQVQIWRVTLDVQGNIAGKWECWLEEKTIYRSIELILDGKDGEDTLIGIGNSVIYRKNGEWRRKELDAHLATGIILAKMPGNELVLAASGSSLFVGGLENDWQRVPGSSKAFVDLCWVDHTGQEKTWMGLTSTGELFRIQDKLID